MIILRVWWLVLFLLLGAVASGRLRLTQLEQLRGGFCDFARIGASRIKGLDGWRG